MARERLSIELHGQDWQPGDLLDLEVGGAANAANCSFDLFRYDLVFLTASASIA
jgi:hypothetical protein